MHDEIPKLELRRKETINEFREYIMNEYFEIQDQTKIRILNFIKKFLFYSEIFIIFVLLIFF